jgi:predicted permease
VAAKGFHGMTIGQQPDLWLPLLMQPQVQPSLEGLRDTLANSTDKLMWLHVFGRRRAGTSIAQVQSEVSVLFRAILEASYPASLPSQDRSQMLNQHLVVRPAGMGAFHGRQAFSQEWTMLLALAGLILLAACANVGSLLLARIASRSREIATRLALGAPKTRLAGQFLTEQLLSAALSGLVGLFVGEVVLRVLLKLISEAHDGFALEAGLDLHVLAFSAIATLATGLLFGLLSATQGLRGNVSQSLHVTGRALIGSRHQRALGKGLVVTQVALSLLLLTGAALFLRSLWNLQSVKLGYSQQNLLLVQIDASDAGYDGVRASHLFEDLAKRIRQIPGVRSVSYSDRGLLSGFGGAFPVQIAGFTSKREEDLGSAGEFIGPDYFATIGIPMMLGRAITTQDLTNPPRVCVINQAFAERFFRGRNPLGRYVGSVLSDDNGKSVPRKLRVIGVARNVHEQSIRGQIDPKFYIPGSGSWLEIRTAHNPDGILSALRKAVFSFDAKLTIQSAKTLQQTLREQSAPSRLIAQLALGFATLAVILAVTGIYGLLSFEVGQRTQEIGIRMALGARKEQVVTMILRQAGAMIIAGIIGGITITAVCIRLVASRLYGFDVSPSWSVARYEHVDSAVQLFGVSPTDPMTITIVVSALFGFVFLSACLPAIRASRLDPAHVLRGE